MLEEVKLNIDSTHIKSWAFYYGYGDHTSVHSVWLGENVICWTHTCPCYFWSFCPVLCTLQFQLCYHPVRMLIVYFSGHVFLQNYSKWFCRPWDKLWSSLERGDWFSCSSREIFEIPLYFQEGQLQLKTGNKSVSNQFTSLGCNICAYMLRVVLYTAAHFLGMSRWCML